MVTMLSVLFGFILTFRLHEPRERVPVKEMKS